MAIKNVVTGYVPPKKFRKLPQYEVKSAQHLVKGADKRILFIFDHIPTEDIERGHMFSGPNGDRFFSLCELANLYYGSKYRERDCNWMAVPFNRFKTYGKENDDIRAEANQSFAEHCREIIVDYKPDVVVIFGKTPLSVMFPEQLQRTKGNWTNLLGTAINISVSAGKKQHDTVIVPTISLNTIFGNNAKDLSYLAGYVARNLVTALDGGVMRYAIPSIYSMRKSKFTPKYKTHYLTKVSEVRSVLKKMAREKFVAVDTETENLYRVHNKVQTVQLCCDPDNAYIIPIYHQDTPFSRKELEQISTMLRDYFERDNRNKVQIYTNAKFDLNVMRTNFGIRHYKADVWDICAGEFALDENCKLISNATGKGYYNLGNLAVQYGCYAFYDNPFGKENRAHIADNPLTEPVLQYCSLDVVVPWLIFKSQLQRAKDIGYKKYRKMVASMVSDQIHAFSILETTGALCDIDYLFYLKTEDSPVNKIIQKSEQDILDSKEVQKANQLISKDKQAPSSGLFGKVTLRHFDLSKTEHKQILFFDVLKLKSTDGKKKRKNGKFEGKIDKAFQKANADNPVVAAFTALQKAGKIRDAYVNTFISKYAEDTDFKRTRRLRPSYSYQDVVTGRTSASDPNLQQIPSRGELSKYIKRLLIGGPDTILIKVDYSAHEVRGWSIISKEKGIADVFDQGRQLRDRYRLVPDPLLKSRIKDEGDVHRINASYFFGVPITQVDESIRNAVKGVIFGLIYQQGDDGLAAATGRKVDDIVKIKKQFLDRFPNGLKWFDQVKTEAKENLFVESPTGRRRTLWPLLFSKQVNSNPKHPANRELRSTINKCLRQAVNSPVQGFGSDFMMLAIRLIDKYKYQYYLDTGTYPDMNLNVSVHDSLTVEVRYEWFWLAIQFIEKAMTTGACEVIKERYDFDVFSVPEIDFEIGPTERDVKKWDLSYESMRGILESALDIQENELKYKVNRKKIMRDVMEGQYHFMPLWLQKQLWANDIKISDMGKNPLSKQDRKLADSYLAELPASIKKLDDIKKAKEKAEKLAEQERMKKEAAGESTEIYGNRR